MMQVFKNIFDKTHCYKIFHKDCRKGLETLQDSSIDCIITDPPYFIDGMGSEWNDINLQTKAKKSVVISWKKVSGANGYQIYVSTKKKSGYKKVADVKKTSATIKKKKGIYYVKVRAFKKTEGKKLSGSFSSICKVNVK